MLTTTDLLDRMLDPVTRALNEEAARRLATLRFDDELEQHIERLGELANEGELTAEQKVEYDLILRVSDVVSVLRLHARDLLPAGVPAV